MKSIARVLILAVEVYFVLDYLETKRKQAYLQGYTKASTDFLELAERMGSNQKKEAQAKKA